LCVFKVFEFLSIFRYIPLVKANSYSRLGNIISQMGNSQEKKFPLSIHERLHELVDELENGQYTVFSRKAGIPSSTFSNYMGGRLPSVIHLFHIYETYHVNLHWLITGDGPKFVDESSDIHNLLSEMQSRIESLERSQHTHETLEDIKKGVAAQK